MKRFQRILVPLSFSDADPAVIAMVAQIARWSEPEELIFCHFNSKFEIPAALREAHPWLVEPIDQAACERMEALVTGQTDFPPAIRISYHVGEANPVHRSLALVLERDCDLIVSGGDKREIVIRLARKAPCSVCIVPANAPTDVRKPMVAVDFSEYSRYASEIGIALAGASDGDRPVLLHLSQIHRGYQWGSFSEDDLIAYNDAHARFKMNEFCLGLGRPKESYSTAVHHHESVPFGILDYVRENGIDCIVAGCRGRDALSAMLLGSDIEQILAHSPVPVFAVKAKGTGRRFIEGLLGMND